MQKYLKAIYGAAVAAVAALQVALIDNVLTWQEGVAIGSAGLAALAVIWAVPNTPVVTDPVPAPPSTEVTP